MRIIFFMLPLLLTACAGIKTIEIPIPLPVPKHQFPPKPHLAIYDLEKNSSDASVAKAYISSVYLQQQWIDAVTS